MSQPAGPPTMPFLERARGLALALFFGTLAVSISASQILLAVLVALAWIGGRSRRIEDRTRSPQGTASGTWRQIPSLLRHPLTAPVLAYTVLSILSALASGDAGWSLWIARDLLRVATFYVVLALTRDAAHALGLWRGFLAVLTLMAGYGLVQGYVCRVQPDALGEAVLSHMCIHPSRVSGPFSIYMTFSGVLLIGTLVFLACLTHLRWRDVGWMAPASAAALAALLLTYSRNAWLGLVAGVLTLLLTARRATPILATLAVLLLVTVVAAPATVVERARSMVDLQDETARDRVAMWRSGLAMIGDHPFLGVGPGEVRAWYPQYRRPEAVRPSTGHLHNSVIQIAAERGLLALAAWLWLWVAFFRQAWHVLRNRGPASPEMRALTCASLAGVIGFLVAGLFEHNFGDAEVVMLVYALAALPFVVARDLGSTTAAPTRPEAGIPLGV